MMGWVASKRICSSSVLPGVIGQDAEKVADRIIKDIQNTNISLLDGRELSVSVSAGIVSSTRITASTEMDNLIQRVIEAVAHAKRAGGNQSHTVFV